MLDGDSTASGRLAQQGFVQGLVSALERASEITSKGSWYKAQRQRLRACRRCRWDTISVNHFSASYKASDFWWQTILYFLEHLRPSHIKRKGSDYVLTAVAGGTRYQDAIFLYDVHSCLQQSISILSLNPCKALFSLLWGMFWRGAAFSRR